MIRKARKFLCGICKKDFNKFSKLKKHAFSAHDKKKLLNQPDLYINPTYDEE